jgi:TonB family protein
MLLRFFKITLFVLLHFCVAAQETRYYYQVFPQSNQVSYGYYILKSNKNVKHGEYISYFRAPRQHYKSIRNNPDSVAHYIWKRGNYVNGKKHGEWVEYRSPGVLQSKGVYDMDKKTGLWLQSRENGEVLEKYNYTTRQRQTPDIQIPVHYPPKARKAGVQGTVEIEYRLQADCSVTETRVIQSVSAECDREAMKNLLKFYAFLKKYGPANGCEAKTDTFVVKFNLE